MDLTPLLRPRSIAVVGASPRSFTGRIALENCRGRGFSGRLSPVNPRYAEVAGLPAVPSIANLDELPDLAVVQVGAARVLGVVADAAAAGVRNFVIPGGGFTDSGSAATVLNQGLDELAATHGIQAVGPNCMGVVDLITGAAPYVGTVPAHVRMGGVAVVAQSGAFVEAIVNAGGRVPLSTAVSSGSEAVTGLADYLDFFADDPHTDAVLAMIEAFGNPEQVIRAARRLAERGKQLAVCLTGRSQQARDGIAAHSGRLAASYRTAAAALEQAGAVLASDLDELIALGEILGTGWLPRGRRLHIVTNSGGEASMLADLAAEAGLELPDLSPATVSALQDRWPTFQPRNPLDPWGVDEYQDVYPAALWAAAAEGGDVLVVAIDQQLSCGDHETQLGRDLASYLADASVRTAAMPLYLSPSSQDPDPQLAEFCRHRQIPLLRGARTALNALAKLDRAGERRAAAAKGKAGPCVGAPRRAAVARALADGLPDSEAAALDLLAGIGVAVPARCMVTTADAAAEAAEELGLVVLKVTAPGLLHKTDRGLVRVGLSGKDVVRAAADELLATAGAAGLDSRLLVMQHVRGELEIFVGYKRDPAFGPTVVCGLGGVWAEELDDAAVHVGAPTGAEAAHLLSRTQAGRMLARARGGSLPAAAVAQAMCSVAALGIAHPRITAIDINPLIVGRHGTWAVDAVIETSLPKDGHVAPNHRDASPSPRPGGRALRRQPGGRSPDSEALRRRHHRDRSHHRRG